MSTISVALCERLADVHATAGHRFVAAPVFGRPDVAAKGKLFIVAAGKPDVIDACMPLFDATGQKTIPIGEVPQVANLVKLSGNFLIASVIEALSEAMALIRKAGIDPHRYFELLTSTLFTGPVFTNYGGLIANERFQPAGFAAPLGEKDIRLHPRGGGNASRPDAAGEPGPRPTSDADRPRRRTARLVGDRATRRE